MLVVTRKSREVVVVGARNGFESLLTVTVLEIRGGKVKLGFEADSSIPIHRWEVWKRIVAAGVPPPAAP
jgi:carbon storage regulator CsrA